MVLLAILSQHLRINDLLLLEPNKSRQYLTSIMKLDGIGQLQPPSLSPCYVN